MAVGFADIVGFTRHSRDLEQGRAGRPGRDLRGPLARVVLEHGGRVIKTIGDEILFAADDWPTRPGSRWTWPRVTS